MMRLNEQITREKSKYNFEGYKEIKTSFTKPKELVASIKEDGSFSINSSLAFLITNKNIQVKIKPDGTQLVILITRELGPETLRFGVSGTIKNYHLQKILKDLNISFPAYYVGEWNKEERLWIGNIVKKDPNYKK